MEFWKQKILGFFIDGPNTLFLNEMSFPRKKQRCFLFSNRELCLFPYVIDAGSEVSFSLAFFRYWCWRQVLPSHLWQKTFGLQFTIKKGKSTNCTQCFHSTLRWKGKNQQNWKESSELKIAPKTKNQYSCRRGCQMYNLACGKVNLEPKWRKLQEKSFELNIAS